MSEKQSTNDAASQFETIAQMLLEQKKLMDALQTENQELRRQLADLQRGEGIAVLIAGRSFVLAPGGIPVLPSDPSLFATSRALETMNGARSAKDRSKTHQ